MQAEELLRAGRLGEALTVLEAQVRANAADAKLRVFLFQLLCVLGEWQRATDQANVAAELDPINLLMARLYGAAIQCEALRSQVFAGKRSPLIMGEPAEWVGRLLQANLLIAEGKYQPAQKLRDSAFEAAPATSGTIDSQSFEWISDADSRLGPMLEAIVDGRYYWVPFAAAKQIRIEAPATLRDLVWVPARFTWTNGGESSGLIPTRYPGTETSREEALKLARRTEWIEQPGATCLGLGQRMFATDQCDYALLDTRQIDLDVSQGPLQSNL